MRIITDIQLRALSEAIDFIEAFVDYHIDETPVEKGVPTDAQILSEIIPSLKSVFGNKDLKQKASADEWLENYDVTDQKTLNDIIYTERRHAAESVNPNYRYCVVRTNLDECWLTDDEVSAMETAIKKSRDGGMWNVCRIFKANDGTYQTRIIAFADNGEYYDRPSAFFGGAYLHFNYIAEVCNNIRKI